MVFEFVTIFQKDFFYHDTVMIVVRLHFVLFSYKQTLSKKKDQR